MTRGGMTRSRGEPERRCIATGESGPTGLLIRFVLGPDAQVVPDLAERLPGRGVWLKADRDLLLARVKRRNNRPLLKTGDPAEIIDRLIAERYPVYAQADIHIQSRDIAHDVVIDDILTALADYLGREAVEEA